MQHYQWKYRILSAEVYISIQYYQWKYTILHSMYSVGATQLWLRVRVPFVDSLLNIQRNSRSITKDHSTDPQSQWPLPGIYLWNYAIFFRINSSSKLVIYISLHRPVALLGNILVIMYQVQTRKLTSFKLFHLHVIHMINTAFGRCS